MATNLGAQEVIGFVMGLGFGRSFGCWGANYVVVQSAMAAESLSGARGSLPWT